MSILTNILPKYANIEGNKYLVNTDFRIGIKAGMLINDLNICDVNKLGLLLRLYFPEMPKNISKATKYIEWFYSCGKKPTNTYENTNENLFCFNRDANYIYAAFYQQYNIDLNEIDLHWWKFCALFCGLQKTKLNDIVTIRGLDISNMPLEQQRHYAELKHIYNLPYTDDEQRQINDIMRKIKNKT